MRDLRLKLYSLLRENRPFRNIEFARSEKMIFNALFMSMTMAGSSLQDIIHAEWNRASIENVKKITGLSTNKSEMIFINCWLYSHGIATQIVSNDISISFDTVTELMTNAFKKFSMGSEE